MKLYVTFILSLIFSFSAFGQTKDIQQLQIQSKTFKSSKRYSIKYDKRDNRTLATFTGFNLIENNEVLGQINSGLVGAGTGNPTSLYLGAGFIFKGQVLNQSPDNYFLYFSYPGNLTNFLRDFKLLMMIDDEIVNFGHAKIIDDVEYNGLSKLISFQASREQMMKIANAKSLHIKIGIIKRELKPEHMEAFKNLFQLGTV